MRCFFPDYLCSMLEIIYQDSYIVAVNKPAGLLVHRTNFAEETEEFLLQKLRNQINQRVYPIHRLDRQTSGVILFALNPTTASLLGKQFQDKHPNKTYFCIVRGYMNEEIELDYAIKKENMKSRVDAVTRFEPLAKVELDIPTGPYNTSRYSLVKAYPQTGKWHQIRQHLGHLRHYIVGDKRHGDHRHNKTWANKLNCPQMMLHAYQLCFTHPETQTDICLKAKFPEYWHRIFKEFGWTADVLNKNR